ncbi:hypothetical protein A2954_01115 [Candidatus Roizmanbacteria bacterium RIFCSPLOWO2_01_FULL_37_12]|uniref:Uncharacterized protein n=1 Tax=Candidatus Roizmanbacteria bacterium RIFCSPLOWO2_01_FULL_37_12 TaxID=1802056 RepID=A0A1F7IGD8_9BACT|nr:MAG: hypothetical protein A2954_01115 [Candidatus Roizmanbacteria bacterium RIFCSPLOWO2_01_FULL_37_12]
MKLKKASILFLLILFIILVFIIGVRRGQQVEKTNKTINYLISIPPSATLQPTQIPLEFKEYIHKGCGLKFLYPSSFLLEKNSSTSGSLRDDKTNNDQLVFNCGSSSGNNKNMPPHPDNTKIELTFKNKKINALISNAKNNYSFMIFNQKNGKNIDIYINKILYPLFEKTLEFLP